MSLGRDLPTMGACNYTNSSYGGAQMLGNAQFISNQTSDASALQNLIARHNDLLPAARDIRTTIKPQEPAMPSRRIVQVYIADPSDAVPLEGSILYTGEQKMTDLTDQELFFEIDIRTILAAHNEKRVKIIDKKIKDRTEYLEPAKVRDLKMVVVTVASF